MRGRCLLAAVVLLAGIAAASFTLVGSALSSASRCSTHQDGPVPLRAAAAPVSAGEGRERGPQPLLMFMTSRTGSSLMTEVLNQHPRVLFEGESFNQEPTWRGADAPALAFFRGGAPEHYAAYRLLDKPFNNPEKDTAGLLTVGFKVRPQQAQLLPGSEGWEALKALDPPPKVVCSYRRSAVKATISELRATDLKALCGGANVQLNKNCSLPAAWNTSSEKFAQYLGWRIESDARHLQLCHRAAESFPVLMLAYEELLEDLPKAVRRVLAFAGLPEAERAPFADALARGSLPIGLVKNTPDDLRALLGSEQLELLRTAAQRVYFEQVAADFD